MKLLECNDRSVRMFLEDDGKFIFAYDDPYTYFSSHIKNSIHLPPSTLRSSYGAIPVQYHRSDMNAIVLYQSGLKPYDKICVYSEASDPECLLSASMVVYELMKFGFKDIHILNGDYKTLDKSLLDQLYPEWANYTSDLDYIQYNDDFVIQFDEVLDKVLYDDEVGIIDARPPTRYGEYKNGSCMISDKRWKINGNIPGSINVWWKSFVDTNKSNHKIKPLSELQNILDENGFEDKDQEIIIYCGTGREIALQYLVMTYLLGYTNIRAYQGSWNEYHYMYLQDNSIPINLTGCYSDR